MSCMPTVVGIKEDTGAAVTSLLALPRLRVVDKGAHPIPDNSEHGSEL